MPITLEKEVPMFFVKTHQRSLAIGMVALAASAVLTGCAGSTSATESPSASVSVHEDLKAMLPEEIKKSGVISVATPLNNPPAIMADASGHASGIAAEVAAGMGNILGVKFEFTESAFAGVIPGLQSGKFDVSMGVIGDTPERQKVLDFVDLMVNKSVLLVQKGNPEGVTDLESACGKSIGVLAGSLQIPKVQKASEACVAAGKSPIQINEYASTPDGQAQVASGRVAAYIAPYLILNHTAKTAGNSETFELASASYPENPWAIGFGKDRGQFAKALQGALQTMVEDGSYAAILSKYESPDAALTADQVLINGAGTAAFAK
jgi:polar amino acid transport system substrate-binding protein